MQSRSSGRPTATQSRWCSRTMCTVVGGGGPEPPESLWTSMERTACAEVGNVFPLYSLPEDTLSIVLGQLPVEQLVTLSTVCRRFAVAAEVPFQTICATQKWQQPRRPRGAAAKPQRYPWQSLYRRHACLACGTRGEFPVRRGWCQKLGGNLLFLLCKRCVGKDYVQARLVQGNLYVDMLGITGKRLLRKRGRPAAAGGPKR